LWYIYYCAEENIHDHVDLLGSYRFGSDVVWLSLSLESIRAECYYVGEVAVVIIVVEAVADDELIGDVEADVVGLEEGAVFDDFTH